MFNISCAFCGKPEISHGLNVEALLKQYYDTWHYHEEPAIGCSHRDSTDEEDAINYLTSHTRGYHFSLENCIGFTYAKKDLSCLIERYCDWMFERHHREVPADMDILYYMRELDVDASLTEKLSGMAKKKLLLLEKAAEEKRSKYNMMPTTVYVSIDSHGRSFVGMGD